MNEYADDFLKYQADIALKGIRIGSIAGAISVLLLLPSELSAFPDSFSDFIIYRSIMLLLMIALATLSFITPKYLSNNYENILIITVLIISFLLARLSLLSGGMTSSYYNGIAQMEILLSVFIPFKKSKIIFTIIFINLFFVFINLHFSNWELNHEDFKQISGAITVFAVISIFVSIMLNNLRYNEFKKRKHIELNNIEIEMQKDKLIEMNSELEKANTSKDKFLSIIAHTLKNPLNGLLLSSENLINYSKKMNREEIMKTNMSIRDISIILIEQLENLLQWARAKYGRIEYDPKVFDISELLLKNIRDLVLLANNKDISINYNGRLGIEVYADYQMVNNIINNLLNNAIKYTYNGGNIQVETIVNENELLINFVDFGTGLGKEIIDELFKVEIVHSRNGTNGESGSGLGLIICKEFIDLHNGKIGAYNNDNTGSTFWFSIPK